MSDKLPVEETTGYSKDLKGKKDDLKGSESDREGQGDHDREAARDEGRRSRR